MTAVVFGAGWWGSAGAAKIPVRDFMSPYTISDVRISPTGRYLSVVAIDRSKHDRRMVDILDLRVLLKTHKVKVLATLWMNVGELVFRSVWINPKRLLVEGALQIGGFDEPFANGSIWAVNADGHRRIHLAGATGDMRPSLFIQRIKGRSRHALFESLGAGTEAQESVWRANIYTGRSVRIMTAPAPNMGLWADPEGKVRLAFGTSLRNGHPRLFWRKPHTLKWVPLETLLKGQDPFVGGVGPLVLTAHGRHFYGLAETTNARRTVGLYRINPDMKKKLIYANPRYDVTDNALFEGGSVILNHARDHVVALRIMGKRPHLIVIDPHSRKAMLQASVVRDFPGDFASIESMTRRADRAIVKVWSDRDPGRYFLYESRPEPKLVYLFRADSKIPVHGLATMKPIAFKSMGGIRVHGYLTLPPHVPAHDLPLIVDVHGGPYTIRDSWMWHPTVQLFANRGYAVLQVNYRGSGGYGARFQELGYRHWGSTMQTDVARGVLWAIRKGIANPKRICIYGGSYGGYAALMNAERYPGLYRCVVGYDGVYDLPMMFTRTEDIDRSVWGRYYLRSVLGRNRAQLRAFSPVDQADHLRAPVLLLQGGRDQRAPVAGYREMVAAIHRHGTPIETLFEPNEGHGFFKTRHRVRAYRTILSFFKRYIGPKVSPDHP
ncbi:prolyl oligopeptidase family protein [mine drainage metagenome]|uniref:Prolyl oligopeptidase family protein n=2 Tax=mine drainage metagenome TaxID=410659 RepID=T1BDY4_9ZZZZ